MKENKLSSDKLEELKLNNEVKQRNLLKGMNFCKTHNIVHKVIADFNGLELNQFLFEISNFYEPIAEYLKSKKELDKSHKQTLGIFGVEFQTDDIAKFLNGLTQIRDKVLYIIAGYIISKYIDKLEDFSKNILDEQLSGKFTEIISTVDEQMEGSITDNYLLQSYLSEISDLYKEYKFSDEYKQEVFYLDIEEVVKKSGVNLDDLSNQELVDYYMNKIYNKDDENATNTYFAFSDFLEKKGFKFINELKMYLLSIQEVVTKGVENKIINALKMTELKEYDYCNKKEVAIIDIVESCMVVYEKFHQSTLFDKYKDEIDLLNSFSSQHIDMLEFSILMIFECSDNDRVVKITKEVKRKVFHFKEKIMFDHAVEMIKKLTGEIIDIKSIEEGTMLIEAINQFYKMVHERMLSVKNENSSKYVEQYENASLKLQTFFRQTGRFEMAEKLEREIFIMPDTIDSLATRWKEYWSNRINKLSGADIKRTTSLMNNLERNVKKTLIQREKDVKERTGKDKRSKKNSDKSKICASKNIHFLTLVEDIGEP